MQQRVTNTETHSATWRPSPGAQPQRSPCATPYPSRCPAPQYVRPNTRPRLCNRRSTAAAMPKPPSRPAASPLPRHAQNSARPAQTAATRGGCAGWAQAGRRSSSALTRRPPHEARCLRGLRTLRIGGAGQRGLNRTGPAAPPRAPASSRGARGRHPQNGDVRVSDQMSQARHALARHTEPAQKQCRCGGGGGSLPRILPPSASPSPSPDSTQAARYTGSPRGWWCSFNQAAPSESATGGCCPRRTYSPPPRWGQRPEVVGLVKSMRAQDQAARFACSTRPHRSPRSNQTAVAQSTGSPRRRRT